MGKQKGRKAYQGLNNRITRDMQQPDNNYMEDL